MQHEFSLGQLVTNTDKFQHRLSTRMVMEVIGVHYVKGRKVEFLCRTESGHDRNFFAEEIQDYKKDAPGVDEEDFKRYLEAVNLYQGEFKAEYPADKAGFYKMRKHAEIWARCYIVESHKDKHGEFAKAMQEERQKAKTRAYTLMYLMPFLHNVMEAATDPIATVS